VAVHLVNSGEARNNVVLNIRSNLLDGGKLKSVRLLTPGRPPLELRVERSDRDYRITVPELGAWAILALGRG
jgi:hypothetical protein